jgi:EAL domain-containing protein (putative c-di-GMP-specific phosphodiesterase class I)
VKSAADLIETAEDAGLIAAVTDFVLGESMREIDEWRRQRGGDAVRLAVNVSGVQIRDGALIPMIERHLRETGFPPESLELEITEATAMRSDASTTAVLTELKRLGIGVVIDDFGTGYSSLSRLHRLPIDGLKIDQSLVQGIEHHADGGALAEAIIAMAHSMRLAVTAEGVETLPQLLFCEERGCQRLQGHVISRPLPPADLAGFQVDVLLRGNSPDVECVY